MLDDVELEDLGGLFKENGGITKDSGTLLELMPVLDGFEGIEESDIKQINDFYTAIVNVRNGIIGKNEMDNLLQDKNFDIDYSDIDYFVIDFNKIEEKIDYFFSLSPLLKNLCLKYHEDILKICDIKEEDIKQINDFYTAIVNVRNGIIGKNEKDNLLQDKNSDIDYSDIDYSDIDYSDIDLYKIDEKLSYFFSLSPLIKDLCLKYYEDILKIYDDKYQNPIGGYGPDYADFNDSYNSKKGNRSNGGK